MEFEIRDLKEKDFNKAIQFAIKGMHFDWYTENKFFLNLYGKYFWYLEVTRATHILALYTDEELAGVLLAEIKGEDKKYRSFWKSFYVRTIDGLQNLFAKDSADLYDQANKEMFSQYCKNHAPDGEIIFLAANPDIQAKGIGSILLREFESSVKGKLIYLYTDNGCTYQFYEHRGFERLGEKKISFKTGKKALELQCLLYSKVT